MSSDSFHKSLQRSLDRDQGGDPWADLPGGTIPEPEFCTALTRVGFKGWTQPPEPDEFCDEEAVDGEDYCDRHLYLADSWGDSA